MNARQLAVDWVAAQLRRVLERDGWRTDAGRFVYTDEPPVVQESAADNPIRTVVFDSNAVPINRRRTAVTVTVTGHVWSERQHPRALARAYIADVRRAVEQPAAMGLPPGVDQAQYVGDDIPQREPQSNWLLPVVEYQILIDSTTTR